MTGPTRPAGRDERTFCQVAQGDFVLERHPVRAREQLRAWDAADSLVLRHVADLDAASGRVMVLGDDWGAITAGLVAGGTGEVVHVGDSFVSQVAMAANLERNGLDLQRVRSCAARSMPSGPFDLLVVKIPRVLATLDEWLRAVRPSLDPATIVVSAAMTRHLHSSTIEVLSARIGTTVTTRAERRARLALSSVDAPVDGRSSWPRTWHLPLDSAGQGPTVVGHVNAFSAERLDPGTALLLSALAQWRGPMPTRLVDLGCGAGVVGLASAWLDRSLEVTFVDESFDAVASAEDGWDATFADRSRARFMVGDGLALAADAVPLEVGSVDRIVVNPPFHIGHALSDATAWDMFVQSRRALRRGGDIWVVGNRHLGYHVKLKRVFGNAELVISDPAFVVLRAERR